MMNVAVTKEIKFYEDTLLGVQTESGEVYLAIRKTVMNIGLNENQADNEVKKVKKGLLFDNQWLDLSVKFDGQSRNTIVLAERYVPLWLAQIKLTPDMKESNPEAVEKLLTYQKECVEILHNAFMGNEDDKKNFYDRFDLKGDIREIMAEEMARIIMPLQSELLGVKNTNQELQTNIIDLSQYINKLNQKHEIFENESSLFSNLLTNFHAKIYNQGSNHPYSYNELYDAITSFTGIYIPKKKEEAIKLKYKSIKDFVLKKFGVEFIKMFNNGILDGRIIRVKSGEFIDLSGVFQNPYEWSKILSAFTSNKTGLLHCCYCKKVMTIDEAQKEHAIHQSDTESSDCIYNILPSCSDCNGQKKNRRYDDWYPKQTFFDENYYTRINNHINKYSIV